jgi:iron(III) transport system substrate-binding protein
VRRSPLAAICTALALAGAAFAASGCGSAEADLIVYSGRSEPLIKPFLEEFAESEDLDIEVRYGETSSLAALLIEEGENTPADVFIAQDAAALVQLDKEGLLQPYSGVLKTPERYRAEDQSWTGLAGRARVLAVRPEDRAPDSVFDLASPRYEGRLVAPIPTNVSFRDWVTAIRVVRGNRFARRYLEALNANNIETLPSNFDAAAAVDRGEFDVGLVNHYYIELIEEEGGDLKAVYTDQGEGEFGVLFNVASAGITASTDRLTNARLLMDYLMEDSVQQRFARANFEYPVLPGLKAAPGVRPLEDIRMTPVSLDKLGAEAEKTDELLDEVGLGQ